MVEGQGGGRAGARTAVMSAGLAGGEVRRGRGGSSPLCCADRQQMHLEVPLELLDLGVDLQVDLNAHAHLDVPLELLDLAFKPRCPGLALGDLLLQPQCLRLHQDVRQTI